MTNVKTFFIFATASVFIGMLASCAYTPKAPFVESYSAMGQFTDPRDGREYRTITIGSQIWMAENLKYAVENSYCYEDDESKCKYGRLYSWSSAKENKLCPEGWHIPYFEEWEILSDAVGGKDVAGMKLRANTGWGEKNNGVDNYKFTLLPSGFRHGDDYEGLDAKAYYWLNGDYSLHRKLPFVNGKYIEYDKYGNHIDEEQPARGVLMFEQKQQEVKSKLWRVRDMKITVNDQKFDPNNDYADDYWLSVRCISDEQVISESENEE
ncbi:MAG: fibrobacter succinogenes major paralogous domain-containing protein [Bacteroidales bacterium]|nr:fibrobacter succinogenes major paralogous domain-containing protein [Bacteroidales bacterium]